MRPRLGPASQGRSFARWRSLSSERAKRRRCKFVSLNYQGSDDEFLDAAAGADRDALVEVLAKIFKTDDALHLRQRRRAQEGENVVGDLSAHRFGMRRRFGVEQ